MGEGAQRDLHHALALGPALVGNRYRREAGYEMRRYCRGSVRPWGRICSALNNCAITESCTNVAGPAYQNSFDTMGRLAGTGRTDLAQTITSGALYNAANELTNIGLGSSDGYESRGYDPHTLLLTSINYAPNGNPQAFTVGYNYQSNLLVSQQVY